MVGIEAGGSWKILALVCTVRKTTSVYHRVRQVPHIKENLDHLVEYPFISKPRNESRVG